MPSKLLIIAATGALALLASMALWPSQKSSKTKGPGWVLISSYQTPTRLPPGLWHN